MKRMGNIGWVVGALVALSGCSDCNPPAPPTPRPPQSLVADAGESAADPCGGLALRANALPTQGPQLSGTVVGNFCYLSSVRNITSPTAPLPATVQGYARRTDGTFSRIDVTLQIAPPASAAFTGPDPQNPECGDCTARSPAPPLYKVTYTAADGTRPLCPGGRDALLVRNFVMEKVAAGTPPPPLSFTFACPGSALYHCALDWGLDPGNEPLFKACLRAETADYCGDGRSSTTVGVPLFLSRDGGHPTSTSWAPTPEATWNADGAICVNAPRVPFRGTSAETVVSFINANCAAVLSTGGPCPIPPAATATAQHELISYVLATGESPLCERGQGCTAAAAVPAIRPGKSAAR